MLQDTHHVVAEPSENGYVTLTLVRKEEIAHAGHEMVPL
jgi:hypothetical protein